ncbi:MAG: hypothetical protein ACLT5P_04985 [Flavonifractor plautii]
MGETIAAILAAAPWTWERECLLLLQPMSAQPFPLLASGPRLYHPTGA